MKTLIYGINGKMGRILYELMLQDARFSLIEGIIPRPPYTLLDVPVYLDIYEARKPEVIIDFSHPSQLKIILEYALEKNVPLVLATTGYKKNDLQMMEEAAKSIPIIYSQNYALGIHILKNVTKYLSQTLTNWEIEIIEKHHRDKIDFPSGTAKLLYDNIVRTDKRMIIGRVSPKTDKSEIGISCIRSGNIVGEHSVLFTSDDEVIEITHQATSKKVFAYGAMEAALFIVNQKPGLYGMEDLLRGKDHG